MMLLGPPGKPPSFTHDYCVAQIIQWVEEHTPEMRMSDPWLAIHQRNHPDAGEYPPADGRPTYAYHTGLRGEHAVKRRYSPP
jgi:hypothetical protein